MNWWTEQDLFLNVFIWHFLFQDGEYISGLHPGCFQVFYGGNGGIMCFFIVRPNFSVVCIAEYMQVIYGYFMGF